MQQICNDRMQFGATDHDKALTKPFDSHQSAMCCKNQSDECLENIITNLIIVFTIIKCLRKAGLNVFVRKNMGFKTFKSYGPHFIGHVKKRCAIFLRWRLYIVDWSIADNNFVVLGGIPSRCHIRHHHNLKTIAP